MNSSDIEKISRQTGVPIRELNKLNHTDWYHGTTLKHAESLQTLGVQAAFNIGLSLDFGAGFYLTDTFQKAQSYIKRVHLIGNLNEATNLKCVVQYEFDPLEVLFGQKNSFKWCHFPKHNHEFAKFVLMNRLRNTFNENPHHYDLIWGVMSDNFPDRIINDLKNGFITEDEALRRIQKPNSMKQLYLGSQDLCDMLKLVTVTKIEREV